MQFEYNLKIEARTETEADSKVNALTILAGKLSVKELVKLAHVVKNDPVKTALAKKYLGV